MTIGIDARLIYQTGVGRYIRNLLSKLSVLDTKNDYIVYLGADAYESFVLPNANWQKRFVPIHWHTWKEQMELPSMYKKDNLDLLHVPYFTIPLLYQKPMIVTIHDLIPLHVMTGKATRLPFFLYWLKWIGYYLMLFFGLRKVKKIIAVSRVTKQELLDHFHIDPKKITVIYEGIEALKTNISKLGKSRKEPYFLYVGNVYPHKNADMVVRAFAKFVKQSKHTDVQLLFVGKEDYFYKRLKKYVFSLHLDTAVQFLGAVDDSTLAELYKGASGLVIPSKMEGFGLPPLEALSLGCPVIASDIPIFREILGTVPFYVPFDSEKRWVEAFALTLDKKKKRTNEEKKNINTVLSRYNWENMAAQTMALYADCTRV